MFSDLTARLGKVIKTLRGESRLTESNTSEMLREIRLSLLEADVALPVVRECIANIREKALGQEVLDSLTPGQALVGVVHQELIRLLGGSTRALQLSVTPPAVILLVGLQGAGKTTTAGKLAVWLKTHQRKKILTVSCDVQRPAAMQQLALVSEQAGVDCYPATSDQTPLAIVKAAQQWAQNHYHDILIVDTAGRQDVDQELMQEAAALHAFLKPAETLFVMDAMLGQRTATIAKTFHDTVPLTGIILSKLDGDMRGGAALSAHYVTGTPIKFAGISEKIDGLVEFDPRRMAERILGMGDIVGLVETVKANIDAQAAKATLESLKKGQGFTLDMFRLQVTQLRKMGGVGQMLDKLPSQWTKGKSSAIQTDQADRDIRRMEGIINAMTKQEREQPEIIKAKRKLRIATGAGVPVYEVNRLLKQFEQMRSMMKQMQKGGGIQKMMQQMGRFLPR